MFLSVIVVARDGDWTPTNSGMFSPTLHLLRLSSLILILMLLPVLQ